VFLEFLFRPIEQLFEGGYTGSRRLDKERAWFTPRRVAKYLTYGVLAAFVSHTLLAFFVGTDNLYRWVFNPPSQHPTAFFFVVLAGGLIWFNFTWFREQTCLIVCPYGRWQSALVDRQSLMVVYDHGRGEPRELGVKNRAPTSGDCIDCKACVQTCPMGIDIRNGWQMECVNCTQCIDSCDEVMTRIGKPRGLIRYASLDQVDGKPRRLLRVRTVFYPAVLAAMVTGLVITLALKAPADITILRGLAGPFSEQPDGRISNQIRVKVSNRTAVEQSYRIEVGGLADENAVIIAPENPLTIAAGETRTTSLFVLLPRRAFVNGERVARLSITDSDGFTDEESYRLLGPVGASR
jgi:cytochrome c oxidase accessory protein FixG